MKQKVGYKKTWYCKHNRFNSTCEDCRREASILKSVHDSLKLKKVRYVTTFYDTDLISDTPKITPLFLRIQQEIKKLAESGKSESLLNVPLIPDMQSIRQMDDGVAIQFYNQIIRQRIVGSIEEVNNYKGKLNLGIGCQIKKETRK